MPKITLNDPSSGFSSASTHIGNNDAIEDALNSKVLWRDNPEGEANSMQNDLDMNSNRILNLPPATTSTEPVTFSQWAENSAAVTVQFNGTVVETFTATAAQTAFTLAAYTYTPGVNNLQLYVNGLKQPPGAYSETSETVFTFAAGLSDGDKVEAVINQRVVDASTIPASSVVFSATIDRSVQDKLAELTSFSDYGILGDGTTDEASKLNSLLSSGKTRITIEKGSVGSTILFGSDLIIPSANTTVYIEAGVTLKAADSSSAVVRINADNVTIEGEGTIECNGQNQTAGGGTVADGRDGITIKDITIRNAYARYMSFTGGGEKITIDNVKCVVDSTVSNTYYGIFFDTDTSGETFNDVSITHNFIDFTLEGASTIGDVIGIRTNGDPAGSFFQDMNITDNVIRFPSGHTSGDRPVGIECTVNQLGVICNDNQVYNGEIGISFGGVERLVCNNNLVVSCADYGIEVAGAAYTNDYNVVAGNNIYGGSVTQYGIRITDSDSMYIGGGYVRSPTVHGVSVLRSNDITIAPIGMLLGATANVIGVDLNTVDGVQVHLGALRATGSNNEAVNLSGTNNDVCIVGGSLKGSFTRSVEVVSGTTDGMVISGMLNNTSASDLVNGGTLTNYRVSGCVGLADASA